MTRTLEATTPKTVNPSRKVATSASSRVRSWGPPLIVFAGIIVVWYAAALYLESLGRTTVLPTSFVPCGCRPRSP
jgi:hypothetical protein